MAVQGEGGRGIVTQVEDRFEIRVGKDLNAAFSSGEEYLLAAPAEGHLVCLDSLLI